MAPEADDIIATKNNEPLKATSAINQDKGLDIIQQNKVIEIKLNISTKGEDTALRMS